MTNPVSAPPKPRPCHCPQADIGFHYDDCPNA